MKRLAAGNDQTPSGRAARLILKIDIVKLLPVGVAHNKTGVVEFLDRPRGGKRRRDVTLRLSHRR